jgi:hypothetical protein
MLRRDEIQPKLSSVSADPIRVHEPDAGNACSGKFSRYASGCHTPVLLSPTPCLTCTLISKPDPKGRLKVPKQVRRILLLPHRALCDAADWPPGRLVSSRRTPWAPCMVPKRFWLHACGPTRAHYTFFHGRNIPFAVGLQNERSL